MLAAIPFAVISSAVAIPSAAGLADKPREFVVYESSLSDILGVLVFYAWLSAAGSLEGFAADLLGGGALSLVAAFLAALALFYFINQIVGHVRFLPLLAGLVFLYAIGKELHLSPLIVVLVCGLIINNPHLVTWHAKLRGIQERHVRADAARVQGPGRRAHLRHQELLLPAARLLDRRHARCCRSRPGWSRSRGIAAILATRWVILKLLRQRDVAQLVWIAPRGLITVLLFLSARETGKLDAISVRRGDAGGAGHGRAHRARASRQRTCRDRAHRRPRSPRRRTGAGAAG